MQTDPKLSLPRTRGNNTLDMLFTTSPETVVCVTTKEPLGDSDHAMIIANLFLIGRNKKHHYRQTNRFDWNKVDWNCYHKDLQRPNMSEIYDSGTSILFSEISLVQSELQTI